MFAPEDRPKKMYCLRLILFTLSRSMSEYSPQSVQPLKTSSVQCRATVSIAYYQPLFVDFHGMFVALWRPLLIPPTLVSSRTSPFPSMFLRPNIFILDHTQTSSATFWKFLTGLQPKMSTKADWKNIFNFQSKP